MVFASDEANAFALPGGKIGVYEGIVRYMENDAQLAAVVGHEIGHNQAHHAAQRMSTSAATDLGIQAIGAALSAGNIGYANEVAGLLGVGAQYGRSEEHTSELQSLMRISYAVFCLKKKKNIRENITS